MANCQNHMNMRSMYRSPQSTCSSAPSCGRQFYPPQGTQRPRTAGRMQGPENGCPDTRDFFPEDTAIAMAYVPWQKWEDLLEPCKGLEHGTIFSQLDKPFLGKGGRQR